MAGHHSRKKLELTGQRFGSLTVLGPADNIGIRTAWRCQCDCGRVVDVRTRGLRGGYTKSCGCQKPDTAPEGGFKGKRHYLGAFRQFDEAVRARRPGEEMFHDQFLREFASTTGNRPAARG